jgi:hypothetical protein
MRNIPMTYTISGKLVIYGYYYVEADSIKEALNKLVMFTGPDFNQPLLNEGKEIDFHITGTSFKHCKAHNSGSEKHILWSPLGKREWSDNDGFIQNGRWSNK